MSFAEPFVSTSTSKISLPAYPLLATLLTRLQPSNLRKLNLWFSYSYFTFLRSIKAILVRCAHRLLSELARILCTLRNGPDSSRLLLRNCARNCRGLFLSLLQRGTRYRCDTRSALLGQADDQQAALTVASRSQSHYGYRRLNACFAHS